MRRYEQRHYCRHCLEMFPPTPGRFPSAHARYILHSDNDHLDMPSAVLACGKYCAGREQADERQHGVKLYGPGSASIKDLVPLIMTYDEAFPEDRD